MQRTETAGLTVECGGPRVYSYEELLRTIARSANVKPMLVPVPFAAWQGLAWIAEMLPGTPVTRNQVDLMQIDTVASGTSLVSPLLGFRRGRWKRSFRTY